MFLERPLPADVTRARRHGIADLLARSAARHPRKIAVVAGDLRQTYAELHDQVRRTATALSARGVGTGDRVVILSRNSHGFVVAYFALARLGAVSVPVNFMLNAREVAYVLGHCDAAAGLLATALQADQIDVFVYDGPTDSLVPVGTPSSELARGQRATGLDRLPLARGGLTVQVYRSGECFLTGRADQEPDERQDLVEALLIRSVMMCRFQSDGGASGVLQALATRPNCFVTTELPFFQAAAAGGRRGLGRISGFAAAEQRETGDGDAERAAQGSLPGNGAAARVAPAPALRNSPETAGRRATGPA